MDKNETLFFEVLRAALRGEKCLQEKKIRILTIAGLNNILPLIADALQEEDAPRIPAAAQARSAAIGQAQRTADFLLLLEELEQKGLRPVVVKGIVCRSLYPKPELRPSVDEDLLIRREDFTAYHEALQAAGFRPEKAGASVEDDYEIAYRNASLPLCLELHTSLFPADSEAYGDCSRFFEGSIERAVPQEIEGRSLLTLAPTDHLLFLLCHAYKHFLHGGIGVRQLSDIALMAEKEGERLDWACIRAACDELHITRLCTAMFRICEKQLGFAMPPAFADVETDETALLDDILSGGLYGGDDIDRAHSSTMTLEAVSADREGRKRRGALHSVFLPLKAMKGYFPYLKKYPWLLPIAWIQRIWRYLTRKIRPEPVDPLKSVQIARDRIQLLKEYEIIH